MCHCQTRIFLWTEQAGLCYNPTSMMNGGDAHKGETAMNDYNEIGARLRELREVSDYTIEELAAELRISPEVYASYEENGKDVPISVIYEIANKFKVDFTEIVTGQSAKLETYHLIRRGGGKVINRNPEYHFEDLAYRYANKVMQPLLVTLRCRIDGKKVFYPICTDKSGNMQFKEVSSNDDLEYGMYNILEPKPICKEYKQKETDIIIVPCLSVDKKGYRIGYGKGYYDRFLQNFQGISLCPCYDELISDVLPTDSFDVKISFSVTQHILKEVIL